MERIDQHLRDHWRLDVWAAVITYIFGFLMLAFGIRTGQPLIVVAASIVSSVLTFAAFATILELGRLAPTIAPAKVEDAE